MMILVCNCETTGKDIMRAMTLAGVLLLSTILSTSASFARSMSPIGSWRGSGIVQPTSGAKERARCRAEIRKAPGRGRYRAHYRCSTSLGMITQSVMIKKVNSRRFTGYFHNNQLNVNGLISITLKGNRQTVTMRSPNGRGWMKLRRH